MNTVKANDLQVLSHYHFLEEGSNRQNKHLIGLKWTKQGSTWKQELVELSKQDVSCWSLFLSLFGIGKLKHISLCLNKICSYLSQYQWKEIKLNISQNPANSNYDAFYTVCHLANRHMQRHQFQLFKAVSDSIQSDFNHYWNHAMQGRYLLSLQRYRLPNANDVELRFKDTKAPVLPGQRLTREDVANIEVGFKYELIIEEEDDDDDDDDDETTLVYYYHYPSTPYYAVDTGSNKLSPRRREI